MIRTQPEPAPKVREAVVTESADGQRLDNFLLGQWRGVPRSHVYRVLRKGEVRVNGKRAKPAQRLAAGDRVRLPPMRVEPEETPRRVPDTLCRTIREAIIFEDDRLLVIDKPAGVAVHGGSGLSFGVIEALRADRPQQELELAHRLDRDTSGCLVVAKRREALRALHALLREGEVEKRYLALLAGRWVLGRKRIDAPLATNRRQGGERVVRVEAEGKESASTFRPVTHFGKRATLVEVDIHTGRTHQIRVHAAHAGHPVAGDDKYGDHDFNRSMKELGLRRLFLHSHSIAFDWPDGRGHFAVSAPLPGDLKRVVDALERAQAPLPRRVADHDSGNCGEDQAGAE
jgi:23S rRNA pseudouridine955/2504/2580 synthase